MYNYAEIRPELFTESGQEMLLKIRDRAFELADLAGAVRSDKLLIGTGSTWTMLACMDRMIELGDLREITTPGKVTGQERVFVRVRKTA